MPPKPPLRLGPSAFSTPQALPKRTTPNELIDAHVHLWQRAELDQMTWNNVLPAGHPLKEEHSLQRYADATHRYRHGKPPNLSGFVYVEVEVKADPKDYAHAVAEVDRLLATASPSPHLPKLLAVVPWAPVTAGPDVLQDYLAKLYSLPSLLTFATTTLSLDRQAEPLAGATPSVLKGVRYIVEGQPVGTATQPAFVSSLKMLGEKNLLFEFCINTTEQGMTVLDEVLECITQVRDGQAEGERTSFVIDHLAKPDLKGAVDSPMYTRGKGFADFTARIFEFALLPEVVIKLSGLLSCAEPEIVQAAFANWLKRRPDLASESYDSPIESAGRYDILKKAIQIFVEPILDSFGFERILFGSDYPIYRSFLFPLAIPSATLDRAAYEFAVSLYCDVLVELGLGGEELDAIFSGNARRIYGI